MIFPFFFFPFKVLHIANIESVQNPCKETQKGPAIGIDLGTTYSCADRRCGQEPGCDEPDQHCFRCQAFDW
ncbi:unnamed protein product, partial [Vitis vinifera]